MSRDGCRLGVLVVAIWAAATLFAPSPAGPVMSAAPEQVTTPQPVRAFDRLYATYTAGDHAVVSRAIRAPQDFQTLRKDLFASIVRWRRDWKRIHAVFLLEVAHATMAFPGLSSEDVLHTAREFLISRPQRLGENPGDDAFEIAWHRTALAMLQKRLMAVAAERYIDDLDKRLIPMAREGAPRLIDPRLTLVAAIAREQWTTPDTIARMGRTADATLEIRRPPAQAAGAIKDALKLFDTALSAPDTAREASVRKGFLLYRLGRFDEALTSLNAAVLPDAGVSDPTVDYWRALFRGKTLEALGRSEEAVRAYEEAGASWPTAQSPRVALAALHMVAGRREDALRAVQTVRQLADDGSGGSDPWLTYWYGEGRFLDARLAHLRKAAVE